MRNSLSDDLVFLNVHMKQLYITPNCNIRISNVKTPRPHTQSGVCCMSVLASAQRAGRETPNMFYTFVENILSCKM
jgi:hypothetical protein